MCAFDLALAPDEGVGVLVPGFAEVLNGFCDSLFGVEARPLKRLAGEDAEPDLHLIKPRGGGRRKVESDVGVRLEPGVVLLVGAITTVRLSVE